MTAYRSFLFAPGNHPRRVEKALTLAADAVILDLEDAVAVSEKVATRPLVAQALTARRTGKLYVRVNGLATDWCHGDLTEVVRPGLDGIILPKTEYPHDLRIADWMLANLERAHGLPVGGVDLIPIIETALGISNLAAICRSGTRARRLAFGAGDFTLDMGMAWSRSEAELLPARSACVMESRAAGMEPPLDTVWADLRDAEGFLASANHAAQLGFQGKMCIHPDQIAGTNAAFSPDEATIARARRIVEAFETAERDGLASIQLDGQFIDYPIVERARRVLRQGGA
ncbi:MAG TPA: CoA ester lyase [Rhodopila sp.]|uniref:HpcH/HpaI aldolase/citrate lyase family protein n=1 Tax=Rhodopila sp. TaxID=2480087 RepID=UPI002B5881FD|nr:CoA ester lyase [Rhodopila sp.]HVY18103.1 CoA ester lyase [Rhodopila sp.]